MKELYAYVSIINNSFKKEILSIQEKIKQITGELDYFLQWPPHFTVSYGNSLNEDELAEIIKTFEKVAIETKPFQIDFDKDPVFSTKILNGTKFFSMKLKIINNRDIGRLSDQLISIADSYECPFKNLFKRDKFHLTLVTTSQITDKEFLILMEESKKWLIPKGVFVDSFSIIKGGPVVNVYPTMDSEIKKFYLHD